MITPASFAVFVTNANTSIREAYSSAPIDYPLFTTTVPTDTTVFEDGWIGRMPKMRVWNGPRIVNEPAPQTYQVTVLPYENTYALDRFHLDDDKLGIYYPILIDLALQAKRWPEFELRDLLENTGAQTGSRQNGLDALSFFNTAHPVDLYDSTKGTYSNDFTGGGMSISGATVGGALSPTAFGTIVEYMMTLKAEDGERLGILPNLLMVPPNLKAESEYILKNTFSAPPQWSTWGSLGTQVGSSDNIYKRFGVEPHVNHNLMSATKWYVMDTTKSIKPLRWILREQPVFTPRVNENDPIVFDSHQYMWGAWGRATPAWSFSWLMARSGP
jgi:phage major head subunit gpT-like protein